MVRRSWSGTLATLVIVAATCGTIAGSLTGCAKGCSGSKSADAPRGDSAASHTPLKSGASLFQFDYETVTDLLIVKSDPNTGDRWTARLQRPDPKSVDWRIHSDGSGGGLLDRKADGYFVLHLLDTLRTIQVTQPGVPGTVESLGLSPPRFALQWRASAPGAPSSEEFELRVGAPSREKGTAFAWIPGQPPFVMNGATLQMLDYIQGFDTLRLKTWAGLTADEVDEIELLRGGKPSFYAQREGADWTDRYHRSVRGDVNTWLETLTHARIQRFVDDAVEASRLRAKIQAAPQREAILKDRHGQATHLWLGSVGGKAYALSSARPEGVFEVFGAALKALNQP